MNTIGERLKWLRKDQKLTQQAFADKLGLKRNTVGGYEIGTVTMSDRTIGDVCAKFAVNESWLRSGEGEPYVKLSRNEEISAFVDEIMQAQSEDFRRRFVSVLARLDVKEWKLLEAMALKLAEEARKEAAPKLHVVKIAGRDGSYEERTMTDDEVADLQAKLDSLPDASEDL